MMKKGDVILIAFLVPVIIISIFVINIFKGDNATKIAVIRQNDREIKRIDLNTVQKPERITVGGKYEEIILVEHGRIRFEEANCPDRICIKTGWLSKNGDIAVCLPNHVVIKIEGKSDKVDGVAY